MGTSAFSAQRAEAFRHILLFSAVVQKEQTSAAESRIPFRLPYGTSRTRALPDLSTQADVALDTRRGVPTMLTARGEFPEGSTGSTRSAGILRLRNCFASRGSSFALDDRPGSRLMTLSASEVWWSCRGSTSTGAEARHLLGAGAALKAPLFHAAAGGGGPRPESRSQAFSDVESHFSQRTRDIDWIRAKARLTR
jgi:hypothetical protein